MYDKYVGPILRLEPKGWDAPPKPQAWQDRIEDERSWSPVLDFGRIPVLEKRTRSFVIRNMCCIPANITLSNKIYVFKVSQSKATIGPFNYLEIEVSSMCKVILIIPLYANYKHNFEQNVSSKILKSFYKTTTFLIYIELSYKEN